MERPSTLQSRSRQIDRRSPRRTVIVIEHLALFRRIERTASSEHIHTGVHYILRHPVSRSFLIAIKAASATQAADSRRRLTTNERTNGTVDASVAAPQASATVLCETFFRSRWYVHSEARPQKSCDGNGARGSDG